MICHKTVDVPTRYRASGCFCLAGEDVLLIQRQRHKPFGLHWAIPTGKIEPGETPAQCMVRELEEELALRVDEASLKQIAHYLVEHDGTAFEYVAFALELDERPRLLLKPDEVLGSEWAAMSAIRKRRVVPYFYNTVADLLEWRDRGSVRHRPKAEPEMMQADLASRSVA